MDHMYFYISIPLVSNITLKVSKTNSLYTALYLLNEEIEDEIPHKALIWFNLAENSWLSWSRFLGPL